MLCEIRKFYPFKAHPEHLDLVSEEVHHSPYPTGWRHHACHWMHRQAVAVTHAVAALNQARNVTRVTPTGLQTKVVARATRRNSCGKSNNGYSQV
jgi:hypothetical protein